MVTLPYWIHKIKVYGKLRRKWYFLIFKFEFGSFWSSDYVLIYNLNVNAYFSFAYRALNVGVAYLIFHINFPAPSEMNVLSIMNVALVLNGVINAVIEDLLRLVSAVVITTDIIAIIDAHVNTIVTDTDAAHRIEQKTNRRILIITLVSSVLLLRTWVWNWVFFCIKEKFGLEVVCFLWKICFYLQYHEVLDQMPLLCFEIS